MLRKLFRRFASPAVADRLIAEGNRLEEQGNAGAACDKYAAAIARAPGHAAAHLNLGIGREALGDLNGAAVSYETALQLDPASPYAAYNLAKVLYAGQVYARAELLLRAALERKPIFPEASVVLSNVLDAQNRPLEAAAALEDALRHRPGYAGALRNYGMVLFRLARWRDAEAALRAALAADAGDAEANYWLGNALVRLDRPQEALASYRRAVELRPQFTAAWCNLGNVLCDLGRREEAMRSLARALELQPDSPDALVGMGNVLAAGESMEQAVDFYRRALVLDSGRVQAQVNLGNALKHQGRTAEALACFESALAIDPSSVQARWSQTMCQIPAIREPGDDLASLRSAFAAQLDALQRWFDAERTLAGVWAVGSEQPFWLAYHEESNREILQRYGRLCGRLMADWQEREGMRPAGRRSGGPLRVGIVSKYFRDHSVWHAIVKGWLQQLERERFAISAFCLGADQDQETAYARSRVVRFEQAGGGLPHWVERIRAAEPEVLIYPEIGMDPMTMKLASLRLAPVQAVAWGHPETSGLPTIDIYLSAQDFEPAEAQNHYTERLVALPGLGCYLEPSGVEASLPLLERYGIANGVPLLLCPGTPFKYAPEHDWILPEIARRLGECRFVFFTHRNRALSEKLRLRLAGAFGRAGSSFERYVSFVPWQQKHEFYGWLQRADVFLDTIGFSGFNTALQAVECGLPIVTREGRFMRGRLASGILKRMQLDELVQDSEEGYIDLAVRLASDRAYREDVSGRIAERRAVLFGDREPIRALEVLLEGLR